MSTIEITEILEKSRKKLLDLTNRNRLLNYPKSKSNNKLIIIDELPDQIFQSLVNENKTMLFKAVTTLSQKELTEQGLSIHPDVKSRAISLGLNPSIEAPMPEKEPSQNHTDNYIQVLHYPYEMDKILSRYNAEAREAIEETGANMLYLIIAFLEWTETKGSAIKHYAPLIMIPVQLEKGALDIETQTYTYKVSYSGEDIITNLALKEKLLRDFGANLPDFEEGMMPEQYLKSFEVLLGHFRDFKIHREFALDFLKFSKILMYLDLDPKRWPDDNGLANNIALQKIFNASLNSNLQLATDYPIDNTPDADKIKLVLDADSSQHSAIIDVLKAKDLVIEGPPGTGKSQTITNIIASAINEEKKVLFVAEKLAALDVVKTRLEACGLGDFCLEIHSHKSHKQRVFQDIANRLERTFLPPAQIEQQIGTIDSIKRSLNRYTYLLSKTLPASGLTYQAILGFSEFYTMESFTPPSIMNADTLTKIDISERVEAISTITRLIEENPDIVNSVWHGFFPSNAITLDADLVIQVWTNYDDALRNLIDSLQNYQKLVKVPLENYEDVKKLIEIASNPFFQTFPNDEVIRIVDQSGDAQLEEILKRIESIIEKFSSLPTINFDMVDNETRLKEIEQIFLEYQNSNWLIKLFSGRYREAKRKANVIFPNIELNKASDHLNITRKFLTDLNTVYFDIINAHILDLAPFLNIKMGRNYTYEEIPSLIPMMKTLLELRHVSFWINEFKNSNFPEILAQKVFTGHASEVQKFLFEFQSNIVDKYEAVEKGVEKLIKFGTFSQTQFYSSVSPSFKIVQNKHEHVSKHLETMKQWIDYSRSASVIKKFNIMWIIDAIREKQIEPNKSLQAFHYAYYKTLSLYIMRDNPELGGFSRQNHEQKIEQFKKLDIELLNLNQQLIAANAANVSCPSGVQNGKVGELTEMGLLKNEIRKKTRHISLRSALVRAPKSIQAIKPCFMMSPMSCAQYLAPGLIEFDLIVMDEASQIRPEDALGSLARAKQIVVVGDPKQLPPTSFFDRKFEDNDLEEDQYIADDSESILDLCLKAFSKPRRLSWHYRSQHESLIAFSNNLFYGGNEGRGLMLFPSPREAGNEYGIKRHYVEHGRFINKYNIPEAEAIVHAVIQHFSSYKSETLGVVAMNALQAQYIIGLLDDARKRDPILDKAMDQHGENGDSFFVKNLENVQGDERDVIFISATYGPDQTGIQHQRFGPINSEHGWRRLNVLITRAKKRIELFTSMLSTNIIPTPKSHLGVIALKGYLKYAETNFLEPAHSNKNNKTATPDSPFEEAVANVIKMAGYEVELQVGVAGYFIDIAVKHPDNLHEYLLAVECDGATYHSSRSARDRDRLREAVLRKMGWEIHRIWSTDWFNHRQTEISRLISVIEKMRKAHPVVIKQSVVETKEETSAKINEEPIIIQTQPTLFSQSEKVTLRDQLVQFRDNIIARHYVIDRHCLLSEDMIENLTHTKPISKVEFRTKIPQYIRTNIDPDQMEYIEDILSIIEESISE